MFFLFLILFLPGRLIKINKIECESQYGECPDEVGLLINNSQLSDLTKTKSDLAKALDGNLLVSDYSTQYIFPDKLKINVLLKKSRFAILNKDTDKYLLLGKNGQILGKAQETSLPTVIQSGDIPNLFALSLMEGVYAMYQINRGEIREKSLVVELASGKSVIFPLEGDRDTLLGALRLIYSEVSDREIDLRFKNPILR